jgi:hypothetical protein
LQNKRHNIKNHLLKRPWVNNILCPFPRIYVHVLLHLNVVFYTKSL